MGIDVDSYLVHGIKIKYDNEFMSEYYDQDNNPNVDEIIIDQMQGEYIVIGNILWSADAKHEDTKFVNVDFNDLKAKEISYKERFIMNFPEYAKLMDEDFTVFAFVHYY